MKNPGNHNKDSILRSVNGTSLYHFYTRFFIRSTNQYVALCTHDYLQDLGIKDR